VRVRFGLKNFVNWLTYSVDVKVYPSLRVLTFKLCVGFMAFLIGISAVIVGIGISYVSRGRIVEIAGVYDRNFSSGHLTDGLLILEDDTPVIYRGTDYQVVMDVTGDAHTRESEFPIALFFTRDRLIIDTAASEAREYKYSEIQSYFEGEIEVTADAIRSLRSVVAFAVFFSGALFCL
jgi:hypothetical protein